MSGFLALQPFISVVIPTHNRLALLKRTLNCLAQQTYPSEFYEIIVVDDGSQDGTRDYLEQLERQGALRYIRQPQQGPAIARNTGVQAARGQVVAFTDDDCLPEPDWLAALAECYASDSDRSPAAVGGRIENLSDGHWLYAFYALQGNRHQANLSERPDYLDTANACFRRSTFLELGGFDEAFPVPGGEDVDLGFRFTAAGYTLQTADRAVVWHVGRNSLTGMLKQSFNRGRGNAILMVRYPERFSGPPGRGMRRQIRRTLDGLVGLAERTPGAVRPLACGLTVALRRMGIVVLELGWFVRVYLPEQKSRYREMGLRPSRTWLYLLLEWGDYLTQQIGNIAGTFCYIYRSVRARQAREEALLHSTNEQN